MPEQPTEADLVSRGIYDPGASDAPEMLAFIKDAIAKGVPIEDLEEFGPSLAAITHRLRPGARYTLEEAAERAGAPADLVARIVRASGLAVSAPDVKAYTDEDVEVFLAFALGHQLFGESLMEQLVRVIGAATARIAEACVSQFSLSLGAQAKEKQLTELDVARWNEVTVSMLPIVVRAMDVLLRRHIEARGRNDVLLTEWGGIDTVDRAIGFCDLVGYTAFSARITAHDLDAALGAFGNRASDIVVDNGGIVVKLIGDEVMFAARNATNACHIALALAEAFAADPVVPEVRVGLAAGEVVVREGDYYGPTVNLAARIVKRSAPGVVLAHAPVRELASEFRYEDAGTHELKGFDDPVPLVVVTR
jgi:class 3 adenylate cyclase